MPQFIYTMKDLRKVTPQGKEILKGIWLSFYHGAKIGVLGANGAGKSTLLRIMAGVDQDFAGEAFLGEGYTVGFLPQEPRSTRRRTCSSTSRRRSPARRRSSPATRSSPPNYSDETADEFARLQDQIDAQNPWELDRQLEIAMDALRLPPADADVATLSGGERRRVALCQVLLRAARPAAARRADQPPRRRVGRLARAPPRRVSGHGRRGHPRPLLPRQRRRLDPRARPRRRHPLGGQLLLLARAEGERGSQQEEKEASARRRTLERELEWVRMAPRARQAKGKARLASYEKLLRRGAGAGDAPRSERDPHPARAAARRPRGRGEGPRARATATSC